MVGIRCPLCGEYMETYWHHLGERHSGAGWDTPDHHCICGRKFSLGEERDRHFAREGKECFLLYQLSGGFVKRG